MKSQDASFLSRLGFDLGYLLLRTVEWLRETRLAANQATSWRLFRKSRHPSVRRYCAYNSEVFNSGFRPADRIILMDCFPIPQWVIANSFLVNKLSAQFDARIASYGVVPRDFYTDALYRSFGCETHLQVKLNASTGKERKRLFRSILPTVKTKQDLFDLRIDGVWIGLDVYESILRTGIPTVEVGTFMFKYQLFHALKYYLYFSGLFAEGIVKSVALSHDSYISMGLVAKIAYRYGVPVYLANPFEIARTVRPHQLYERLRKYSDYFTALEDAEKARGIAWARERLEKRVKGVVGVNMSYQNVSSFGGARTGRQTFETDKLKIVVATHCFFDNPHGYGAVLFPDFYEWLCFLGEISTITDYEWYLKPHPDYLPGTLETLSEIAGRYPKLRLIDPATSFDQLREEGVSIALTCYGSIGHELPFLGYKVINAAYNPHIAYRFNWHPASIEDYRDILMNLQNLGDVQDVDKIYEFFYINKVYTQPDDFLFESFERYLSDAGGDPLSVTAYDAFLSQCDVVRAKADRKMDAFLRSDKTYYFELNH